MLRADPLNWPQTWPNLPSLNKKNASQHRAFLFSSSHFKLHWYLKGISRNGTARSTLACHSCIHQQLRSSLSDELQILLTRKPIQSSLDKRTALISLGKWFQCRRMYTGWAPVSKVLSCWSADMENKGKTPQAPLGGGWQFKLQMLLESLHKITFGC